MFTSRLASRLATRSTKFGIVPRASLFTLQNAAQPQRTAALRRLNAPVASLQLVAPHCAPKTATGAVRSRTENPYGWRMYSTTTAETAEKEQVESDRYTKPMAWLHWIGAAGISFCVVSALIAGQIPNDKEKTSEGKLKFRGQLMHLHESVGLLMLAAMFPRFAYRFTSRLPKHVPVPQWQQWASSVSHGLLYGVIAFMPISGFAFGYLSGWGVPFFFWNVPGTTKEKAERPFNKRWEKFFYENHHRVGHFLTYYLLPAHIGAVAFHYMFRGHNLLLRMNPFK